MLRLGAATFAMVLGAAAMAAAQDDDFAQLDRLALPDGSAEVSVARRLDGRQATFGLSVSRTRQDGDIVAESGGEAMSGVRIAGRRRPARLRVVRLMCEEPVGIVGTVTRRVARVELVAADGSVTRLPRQRPPSGWGFGGRVVGSVQPSAASVREVRAKLRGGKVVARVRPEPASPCPEP